MSNYIRSKVPGATYFFTARLADQRSTLLVTEVALLRQKMRETMARYPFSIDAIVVLPAVIHTIWTLPAADPDFSTRWSFLKTRFSRALPQTVALSPMQSARRERGIWQRRFWEHRIRSVHDLQAHRALIHAAPVQSRLVQEPEDWAWTSLHRDLAIAHRHANAKPPEKLSEMKLGTKASIRRARG